METKKRTKLIEAIIKQYAPLLYEMQDSKNHTINYCVENVRDICNIIWDTANKELDEICELKADKEILEQRIIGLEDIILFNDKQVQSQLSQIQELKQENKELIEEIESNKLHLQDTYEEMQRTNQAEYERGLEEGWNNCVDADNNEH